MPNPNIERAKRIAVQRIANRKTSAFEHLDLSDLSTESIEKWLNQHKENLQVPNLNVGQLDRDKAKRFEKELREREKTASGQASVKTALNWEMAPDGSDYLYRIGDSRNGEEVWAVVGEDDDGFWCSVTVNGNGVGYPEVNFSSLEDAKSEAERLIGENSRFAANKKEGNMTDIATARQAAIARARARVAKPKTANEVDPETAADDGALDDVETVDVQAPVEVTHVTDNTPEQHSVDGAPENKDTIAIDVKDSKDAFDTIQIVPKASSVKKASTAKIMELADLYITAGISEQSDKYNRIAEFETLDSNTVHDRINLLKQVNAKAASVPARRTASVVPPRVIRRTANSPFSGTRTASVSDDSDALLFHH